MINRTNAQGRKRDSREECTTVGDWCIYRGETQWYICIFLPSMTTPTSLPIQRRTFSNERAWGWDGNFDEPSLQPSIWHNKAGACPDEGEWHGYLTKGIFVSC